jgi:hypothetical protein
MILITVTALAGCGPSSFSQTPFQRQAGDAASSYSAAATTLQYLHDGKLDSRFATSSLIVYRQATQGIQKTLPDLGGAPDDASLQPVLVQIEAAEEVMDQPCLSDDCDWQTQIKTLNAAKDSLLEVST